MILVTGSAGYIGSQITEYFEKNNINYIGIDNFLYSIPANITNKKRFIKTDFKDSKKITKIIKKFNIDTIIHCAAASYVLEGEFKKKKYIKNNYKNTIIFINVCKKNFVKNFIFLSSSNVYSQSNMSYREDSKKKPKNIYGKTKLRIENYLLTRKFESVIILRLFNIIGLIKKFYTPNKINRKYQRLITNLFNSIKKKEITIRYKKKANKNIYPSRDFLDIRDFLIFIKKIIYLLKKNKINKIILNLGSGKTTSINKVIYLCKKKFNLNIKLNFIEISNKEIMITKANINKSKKIIKWNPRITILSSLKSYSNFLK